MLGDVLRVFHGGACYVFPQNVDVGPAPELSMDRSESSEEGRAVFDESGLFSSDAEAVVAFGRANVLAREAGCHEDCDVWASFEDFSEVVGRR